MGRLKTGMRAFAFLLLASVSIAEPLPPASHIPIEAFTRHDDVGMLKISPDGQFVALGSGRFGREYLLFIDLNTMKVASGVRAPERFEIDDFDWVSSTRVIYMIAERQPGQVRPVPTGEIFAVDRDGKKNRMLYGYRAGQQEQNPTPHRGRRKDTFATAVLISPLRSNDDQILIAEYPWTLTGSRWRLNQDAPPRITLLNVYNGAAKLVEHAPLRGARVLVDHQDQIRFAVGANEEMKFSVSWKPQLDSPWTEFALPGFRDESVVPLRFTPANDAVLFTGVKEGESLSALFKLELTTREVTKVYQFEGFDVAGVVSDFTNTNIIGVRSSADRQRYHWIVPEDPAARLHAALERAFTGRTVSVTSTSDDGGLAMVFAYSDTNPGDYYLFNTRTKKADLVRSTRSWISSKGMRPMEPIKLTARDGLELHGYLTRPPGAGPHPLIVLPHGGPHGVRDVWGFDPEVQLFANRGYAVLQVNYRGSDGYGFDFEIAGYQQWGAAMQDDLTDATRWAIDQGIAQADRICIVGASYGGYAALMGVAREPKLYQCAIGYVGVYDLQLMFESGDIPYSRQGVAYLDRVLGKDAADLRARSPVHLADKIEAPVLLIHGKEDWRADYKHSKLMLKALQAHKKPVELMSLSREGHGAYDEETRREVYERMLAFLAQHLPVNTSAAANAPAPAP